MRTTDSPQTAPTRIQLSTGQSYYLWSRRDAVLVVEAGSIRLRESPEWLSDAVLRTLSTIHEGQYYQIKNAPLAPKPVQGHLPILIGGGGEQVTLRLAAKYADEWNTWGTPETLKHKIEVLNQHCEEVGRVPGTVWHSAAAHGGSGTDHPQPLR